MVLRRDYSGRQRAQNYAMTGADDNTAARNLLPMAGL
jgi:hypothetical protein